MKSEPRWYGVSTGDGNMGVSHMFPDYYVFTNDPWELAERAAKSSLKPDVEFEVDGEAEYTIHAVVYDDPSFYDDYDENADHSDWESGPCPFILEVFPVDPDEVFAEQTVYPQRPADVRFRTKNAPAYNSISEALGEESVA